MKVSSVENDVKSAEITFHNFDYPKIEKNGIFRSRIRFIILALTTICLSLGMSNATALHFTVICMKSEAKMDGNFTNGSVNASSNPHSQSMFTFKEQSWLFSSLFAGTLLCGLTLDFLCNLIGVRSVITLFGLASGLAMFATPIGALYLPNPANFYAVLVARFVQGFILTLGFLVADKLTKWSTIEEATLFIGIVSTNFTLGRTITMLAAGLLCESPLGWPSVYYIFGTLTLAFILTFYWFYRELPQDHWKVTASELAHIQKGKVEKTGPIVKGTYFELLSNPHVLAMITANIGIQMGNQTFSQYGPTYLKKAIGLSTQQSGYIASLPYVISAILATFVVGACNRFLKGRMKLILVLTTSCMQYGMGICFLALTFVPLSMPVLIQFLYIVSILFVGIWVIGVIKHMQFLSKSQSQRLMAMNTTICYFYVTLVPSFVNLFISQEDVTDISKWNRLFLITAGSLMASGFISQVSILTTKKEN